MTPFEKRFLTDEFGGLFENLDAETGMIVSFDVVRMGETTSWVIVAWDVSVVKRQGDEIATMRL